MDNSSLNASHRYARQAHKSLRSGKFDEAIYYHELARGKIQETMNTVNPSMGKVLESLRLQKQFHSRQIDLIIIRREQNEKCMAIQAAVDQLGSVFRANLEDSRQVQVELFKSLDNAEKVVEVLEQKILGTGTRPEASEFLSKLFEDLRTVNQQSMILVNSLVAQLDERIAENETLRELCPDSNAKVPGPPRTSSLDKKEKGLSDSDPELHKLEELAPLELPSFDFNTFGTCETEATAEASGAPQDTTNLRRIGFSSLQEGEGEEAEEADNRK